MTQWGSVFILGSSHVPLNSLMLNPIAWAEGDWSARTYKNMKVAHSLIYLSIQHMYIKCPFCANHCVIGKLLKEEAWLKGFFG